MNPDHISAIAEFESLCAKGDSEAAVEYLMPIVGAETLLLLIARIITLQLTASYGTTDKAVQAATLVAADMVLADEVQP